MKGYKLTDKKDKSWNKCQWGENVEHRAKGKGKLCTKNWIHFHKKSLLAVLFNPLQGEYDLDTAHLWECEITGKIKGDRELRWGATKVKTLKQFPLPEITIEQRIKIGILCALKVYKDKKFIKWASKWLSGRNRTARAAEKAYDIADNIAWAIDETGYAARRAEKKNNWDITTWNTVEAAISAASSAALSASYAAFAAKEIMICQTHKATDCATEAATYAIQATNYTTHIIENIVEVAPYIVKTVTYITKINLNKIIKETIKEKK